MNVAATAANSVAASGEENGRTLSDQTVETSGPTAPIEILRMAQSRSMLAHLAGPRLFFGTTQPTLPLGGSLCQKGQPANR